MRDQQLPSSLPKSRFPLKVSLLYAFLGCLWILFSDALVRSLTSDPDVLLKMQVGKGWFFIFATTIMLFLLLRDHVRQADRAARTLAESEFKYRQFFESNPHSMWVFDRETLQFLAVNDAAIAHYGYSRDEFLAMKLTDIRRPDEVEPLLQVLEEPLDVYRRYGIRRHLKKGGETILADITAHDLVFQGRPAALVLVHDVTEQQRHEKLLAGQKRILELVVANTPLEKTLEELILFMEQESDEAICSILLLDQEGEKLRWGAAPNLPDSYNRLVDGLAVGPVNGSCGTAVYRRERVIVTDIASDPLWASSRDVALAHGLRACTSMPIVGGRGEILGTFAFYYRIRRSPTDYDLRLIDASSALAGIVIEHSRAEQSLLESEEKYRLLFEAESDAIIVFDLETHRVLEVNNAALTLYGYSRQELLGFRSEDISAEPEVTSRAVDDAAGSTFSRVPLRWHRKKDGTVFPVEISAAVYTYRGKRLVCSAHRDITDRKRAEEMLRNVAEGVSAATGDDFFRLLVEFLGKTLEMEFALVGEMDAGGRQVATLASYANGEIVSNLTYDLEHTPCEHVTAGELCSYIDNVARLFPKDTLLADLNVQSYVGMPLRDSAGRTMGLIAVMGTKPLADQAMTETMLRIFATRASAELERKKWEAELRRNEELLSTVLDSLPVGVWILDRSGQIVRTNPAGESIWEGARYVGIDRFAEYRGWFVETGKLIEPDEWAAAKAVLHGTVSLDELIEIEAFDGTRKTILNSAGPIRDKDDAVVGAVVVNQDVTEKRKLEEQLRHAQKMEAIGTLTGGIAHDFNNILTAVIGYCSILRMKMKPDDPLLVFVDNLTASAERASDLTRSLLAFSRKQILAPQPSDLNDIVANMEKLIVRLIGENIQVRTSIFADPLVIMADRGQIEQILMNLATNARDAMPEGGMLFFSTAVVELDAEFHRIHGYGAPGRYACLSVSDTGRGMDEETRKRIFEPFYTTKEVGKGTGLGLSIVYGIVKQHRGYINVYSEPSSGTGVTIYFPLVDEKIRQETAPFSPEVLRGNETLLLAEDNEEVRRLTRLVLEEFGYSVIEAADGVEAIERFRDYVDGISLVILDVVMPRKNGKEALEEIRKVRPDIPSMLTSGYPLDILTNRDIFEEGQMFISKPVLPHELLRKIRQALDAKE